MMGNSGTGKTHLATALAKDAYTREKKVRFFRITELITTLMEAQEDLQLLRLRARLSKLDLLVLDKLAYVQTIKAGVDLFFDVIFTTNERTSLIVTIDLPFEQWIKVLGSKRLTGALLDQLTLRCQILEMKGPSYRFNEAKERSQRKVKTIEMIL